MSGSVECLTETVDASMELCSKHFFNQVSGGRICLAGMLSNLTVGDHFAKDHFMRRFEKPLWTPKIWKMEEVACSDARLIAEICRDSLAKKAGCKKVSRRSQRATR